MTKTAILMGIIAGASIGLILPVGLNVIVGLAVAVWVAKWWASVSVIEIEDDEYFI